MTSTILSASSLTRSIFQDYRSPLGKPKRLIAYSSRVTATVAVAAASERAELIAKHCVAKEDYNIYNATEHELLRFFVKTFNKTCYLEFKKSKT